MANILVDTYKNILDGLKNARSNASEKIEDNAKAANAFAELLEYTGKLIAMPFKAIYNALTNGKGGDGTLGKVADFFGKGASKTWDVFNNVAAGAMRNPVLKPIMAVLIIFGVAKAIHSHAKNKKKQNQADALNQQAAAIRENTNAKLRNAEEYQVGNGYVGDREVTSDHADSLKKSKSTQKERAFA